MGAPSAGQAALAAAATAGPYFTIQPWSAGPGWRPFGELLSDPPVLLGRVGQARRVLAGNAGCAAGAVEPRVTASVVFLGLAAQLVSPLLGAAVLAGVLPQLTVAGLYWRPVASGPWPLATRPVDGTRIGGLATGAGGVAASGPELVTGQTAALLADRVARLTGPLAGAFRDTFRLSGQVLRGNVGSAVAGAAATLASADPARAGQAAELAAGILARPPLRGVGEFGPGRRFRRRSCCLLYRVPGAGMCGDCILAQRPASR